MTAQPDEPKTPEAAPSADAPAPGAPPAESLGDRAPRQAYQAAGRPSSGGYVVVAGFALFAAGIAWFAVESDTSAMWVTAVWIAISALMILGPLAWHAVDWFSDVSKRGARARLGALAFVTLTVALGLLVFGIASALNVKFKDKLPEIDLTASSDFTLGDETTRRLDKIEGTVYATYIEYEREGTDFNIRPRAQEQLKVYARHTSKVVVRILQPDRSPAEAQSYLRSVGIDETTSGDTQDVILFTYAEPGREVERGKQKEVRVDAFTFVKRSPMTGGAAWLGERVITSAIQELVFQRYKVCVTGGHGESSLADDMREVRDRLAGQNLEIAGKPLDLAASGRVPEDCNLLLVLGPKQPFPAEEAQAIDAYLAKGGSVVVTLDVSEKGERETGLEAVLAKYGIEPRINYVVMAPVVIRLQNQEGGIGDMQPQFPVTTAYADHPSVRVLREGGGRTTYFLISSFLQIDSEPKEGLEVDPVVWAPEVPAEFQQQLRPHAAQVYSGRKDYKTPDPSRDKTGVRLPIAAVATLKSSDLTPGVQRKDGRLAVVADTDAFLDHVAHQRPANVDLFNGLAQWCLGREELTSVGEKTVEMLQVSIDLRQARMAMWWPLVVTLLALFAGAGVWWSRRR